MFFKFNQIEYLEKGCFSGLVNLKKLNISKNELKKLDENQFEELDRLEMLDLKNNEIEFLEKGCFSGLNSLKLLYLSENKVKSLDKNKFEASNQLEWLDLNNQIELLETDWFLGLNYVRYLYFEIKWVYNNVKDFSYHPPYHAILQHLKLRLILYPIF